MHSTGCHCRECFGLAEYMLEHHGRDFGLPRVTTFGAPLISLEDACDGSMLCSCKRCSKERAARVDAGVREDASSPFRRAA